MTMTYKTIRGQPRIPRPNNENEEKTNGKNITQGRGTGLINHNPPHPHNPPEGMVATNASLGTRETQGRIPKQ